MLLGREKRSYLIEVCENDHRSPQASHLSALSHEQMKLTVEGPGTKLASYLRAGVLRCAKEWLEKSDFALAETGFRRF